MDRRKKSVNLSFTGEEHRSLENELKKRIYTNSINKELQETQKKAKTFESAVDDDKWESF